MKMRKWHNLIIILIIMSLFGCRTMDGQGSAAGAGTYPLKSTPAAEDTVLLTVVDGTKAGGFDIRRTPVANMPVSTPVSTALGLKQDAATAITEGDVQDIVDDAVAGIPGSTITPDTITPTKAAIAVTADTIAGSGITQSPTYRLATDTEKSTWNAKVDPGDLASATVAHSSTSDSATSAASVDPVKTSGVPGMMSVFEADGTSTLKTGFIGPANSTVNFVYQFPNGISTPGDTFVTGTPLTGQTLPDGSTGTIIPLIHAAGGGADVPDGTLTNDILSWDGDSWEPIALTAHPAFASLLTAFTNAGLNSFTFDFTSPIYTNDTTPTITVDVADTSTTYAVDGVNYKLGSGEYAAMTNTTGDTWSVTLPTQAAGTYDLQFNAVDDKSTPNTGESSAYPDALIVDLTAPVIVAGADSTHDGSTPVTATMALTELYPDPSTLLYTVTGGTPASGTWAGTYPNYSVEITPTGTGNIVVTSSGSDLAGNVGTASSSNIVYEAVGSCDKYIDTATAVGSGTPVGSEDLRYYVGMIVNATNATHTICQANFRAHSIAGDISGKTFVAKIFSKTGTALNTELGSSNTISGADISAGEILTFTFSTPVETAAGEVVVITMSGTDGANYLSVTTSNTDTSSGYASFARYASNKTLSFASLTTFMHGALYE